MNQHGPNIERNYHRTNASFETQAVESPLDVPTGDAMSLEVGVFRVVLPLKGGK